jgi:hypothetical protein
VEVGGLRDRRRFLKPSDSNEAPFQTDAKTFSSDSIYGKVRPVLACFSGRSEEHQNFVAEVELHWNSTEQSPQNQIDQLYSEALILI